MGCSASTNASNPKTVDQTSGLEYLKFPHFSRQPN